MATPPFPLDHVRSIAAFLFLSDHMFSGDFPISAHPRVLALAFLVPQNHVCSLHIGVSSPAIRPRVFFTKIVTLPKMVTPPTACVFYDFFPSTPRPCSDWRAPSPLFIPHHVRSLYNKYMVPVLFLM